MKHVSVQTFKEVVEAEQKNPSVDFINVCTPAEYKERHISGVRNVPLNELGEHLDEFRTKETVYIHCRSGNRGRQAIEKLQELGVHAELINVEGGLTAWNDAGFATVASSTRRMPIMQQTLLAAGSLVLIGYGLSFVSPYFIFLSVFVGAGLTFAGITGWCGMSYALAKMPWNR